MRVCCVCVCVCVCIHPIVSCNRYKEQKKAKQGLEKAQRSMEERLMSDIGRDAEEKKKRFEHYHNRYVGHCQSVQVSTPLPWV